MAKARATQSATPAAMADYVPEGLPDTGVVATEGQNQPQTTTATVDAAMEPSGGNTMLPTSVGENSIGAVWNEPGSHLIAVPAMVTPVEIEALGYEPEYVAMRLKRGGANAPNERRAVKLLLKALRDRRARLRDEREPLVTTPADAVRWLIQQMAVAMGHNSSHESGEATEQPIGS